MHKYLFMKTFDFYVIIYYNFVFKISPMVLIVQWVRNVQCGLRVTTTTGTRVSFLLNRFFICFYNIANTFLTYHFCNQSNIIYETNMEILLWQFKIFYYLHIFIFICNALSYIYCKSAKYITKWQYYNIFYKTYISYDYKDLSLNA